MSPGLDSFPGCSSAGRTKAQAGEMRTLSRSCARGKGARRREFALAVHLVSLAAILAVAKGTGEDRLSLPDAVRSMMGSGEVKAITAEDRPQRLERQKSSGGAATHHSASLRAEVTDTAELGWGTTVSLSATPVLNIPVVSLRTGGTNHPQFRPPVFTLSADPLLVDISALYRLGKSARHCNSQLLLTDSPFATLGPRTAPPPPLTLRSPRLC